MGLCDILRHQTLSRAQHNPLHYLHAKPNLWGSRINKEYVDQF